jgi:hypothetical protein
MKPGTDCRDTGAKTGAKIQSADPAEERRRLARLSDQWADYAAECGRLGYPESAAFFAEGADRLAAEARAV